MKRTITQRLRLALKSHRNSASDRNQHLGIAMLLVLVCLATATIATTAYLTSRDNSAVIGQNVAESAAAQWAAASGLDTALVLLQAQGDWRSLHVNGVLFNNFSVAGASVTVEVEDLLTGQPPALASSYITVTATARVGSAQQTAGAIVHVPGPLDEAVVIDLSEFAVFFSDTLELRDRAILARWPKSPVARLGSRVAVGTTSTASSSIVIREEAAAIDVTAYTPPTRSSTLISRDSGPEVDEVVLPDALPYPDPPQLIGLVDVTTPTPTSYVLPSGTFVVKQDSRFHSMELKNNSMMTFEGDITVVLEDNMLINTNAKLIIDGDVTLIVFGNLVMDSGAIELRDGATLTTFVRGKALATWAVDVRNSYIGDRRTTSDVDATGEASWMDPERIRFYSIDNALADAGWRLRGNSVFKGEIFAPDAGELRLEGVSALYGRAASSSVHVREDSAIFYCHTLKPYHGFTNLDGALYDDGGRLRDEFKLIASLDAIVLETLATSTRTVIRLGKDVIGDAEDAITDTDTTVSVSNVSLGGTVARIERKLR